MQKKILLSLFAGAVVAAGTAQAAEATFSGSVKAFAQYMQEKDVKKGGATPADDGSDNSLTMNGVGSVGVGIVEDLGGSEAFANLGFGVSTATSALIAEEQSSHVGIRGDFGSISLGWQDNAYDDMVIEMTDRMEELNPSNERSLEVSGDKGSKNSKFKYAFSNEMFKVAVDIGMQDKRGIDGEFDDAGEYVSGGMQDANMADNFGLAGQARLMDGALTIGLGVHSVQVVDMEKTDGSTTAGMYSGLGVSYSMDAGPGSLTGALGYHMKDEKASGVIDGVNAIQIYGAFNWDVNKVDLQLTMYTDPNDDDAADVSGKNSSMDIALGYRRSVTDNLMYFTELRMGSGDGYKDMDAGKEVDNAETALATGLSLSF